MMVRLRFRYLLPLIMVPLFLLAFLRVETRWRRCKAGESGACFNYPSYLPYPAAQAIGIHALVLLPAAVLQQLPDSIDCCNHYRGRPQLSRYIITTLSVTIFWGLLGLWIERLLTARRLSSRRRLARFGMLLLLGLAVVLGIGILRAIHGFWHGPLAPDSAVIPVLLLEVLIAAELTSIPALLQKSAIRAVLASVLLCLYVWADAEYRGAQHDYHREQTSQSSFTRFPPFLNVRPEALDALTLQGPAVLVAELPALFLAPRWTGHWVAFGYRYVVIWLYWFVLASLAARSWSRYGSIRVVVRTLCGLVFVLSLLGWVVGTSPHGYNGSFGVLAGTAIVFFALRPAFSTLNLSEGHCEPDGCHSRSGASIHPVRVDPPNPSACKNQPETS